jgi:periplasmic protein TonB
MFEDSTFESTRRIRTRSRRWMIVTFAFNLSVLLALILIPLFYPEALTGKAITRLITAPPIPVEQPRPVVRPERAPLMQTQMPEGVLVAPTRIPRDPYVALTPEPPTAIALTDPAFGGSGPSGIPGGLPHGSGASPNIVQAPIGPKRITSVVAIGLLFHKVIPEYPPIPRTMRIEGTVVLQATISKSGTIENLRVVSGPAMLQQAALDAVKQWQYKPYLLNGEPVEVETTVNVEFKLN